MKNKNIYWYDVLFNADARNNFQLAREFAEAVTIEDVLKEQKRFDTLFKMNLQINTK